MGNDRNSKSKEELKHELDTLWTQLADKINEYGSRIRNNSEVNRKEMTAHLNRLKRMQLRVNNYMTDIYGTEETAWKSFRKEAENTVKEIRSELQGNVPVSA